MGWPCYYSGTIVASKKSLQRIVVQGAAALFGLAGLAAGWAAFAQPAPTAQAKAPRTIDFNRDVRPILSESCFTCHGPDAAAVQAGLRLDLRDDAIKDRGGYAAIVPGSPEKSRLWHRVSAKEPSEIMPPTYSEVKPLTPDQIETLRLWILQGAKYSRHWAFEVPVKPPMPKVSNPRWVRNEVDLLVMANLDAHGLIPEGEADRRTLARRASLALVGLPPSPEEVEALVRDPDPNAYEKYVDRLLDDPRYGEHQARYWLDAVRYGDTHGLHLDNERSVFPYRDWVVRKFNEDLPYNKFLLWQVAGDLLPNPTTDQLIATGFVRMNPSTAEGGAIEEEVHAKNTFDRVETASTVLLGLTVGCARCHDHKYDPISHKDYFSLYAFFNSGADTPLDGNAFIHGPVIKAPTPEQEAALTGWRRDMDALEARVDVSTARRWLREARPVPVNLGEWSASPVFEAKDFDTAYGTNFGPEPGNGAKEVEWSPLALKLGEINGDLVKKENAARYFRATVTVAESKKAALSFGSDDGIRVWLNGKLVLDQKVFRPAALDQNVLDVDLQKGDNALLVKLVNSGGQDGLAVSALDPLARRMEALTFRLSNPLDERTETDLRAMFLAEGPISSDASAYRTLAKQYADLNAAIPETYIAREADKVRPAFVLKRGQYDMPTVRVGRAIPAALGKLTDHEPKNRLGLAQWMISDRNPLVSRVYVNRIWQQHFAHGLVSTPEDFGMQGEYPINKDLLDYLAVWFKENGWSNKALHRLLLTSATFRQASFATSKKLALDPMNRLVSRGPRYRLDAEVLRDQALFVSGLLVQKPGGKGDKPYQPEGLWEAISYPSSNTAKYVQDHGEALYRRSLYLFWKRTSPPPTMMAFDAPMREACTVKRPRTNTPLQALVTLNATSFVEAARHFAERVMKEQDDARRLDTAFRLALAREPSEGERLVLLKALDRYREQYSQRVEDAKKLLSTGEKPRDASLDPVEHAAWTLICNTIFNLDEFLTLQ